MKSVSFGPGITLQETSHHLNLSLNTGARSKQAYRWYCTSLKQFIQSLDGRHHIQIQNIFKDAYLGFRKTCQMLTELSAAGRLLPWQYKALHHHYIQGKMIVIPAGYTLPSPHEFTLIAIDNYLIIGDQALNEHRYGSLSIFKLPSNITPKALRSLSRLKGHATTQALTQITISDKYLWYAGHKSTAPNQVCAYFNKSLALLGFLIVANYRLTQSKTKAIQQAHIQFQRFICFDHHLTLERVLDKHHQKQRIYAAYLRKYHLDTNHTNQVKQIISYQGKINVKKKLQQKARHGDYLSLSALAWMDNIKIQNLKTLKEFARHYKVTKRRLYDQALYYWCKFNLTREVSALLSEKKLNLNLIINYDCCLSWAIKHQNLALVGHLLNQQANSDLVLPGGQTLLMLACEIGNLAIVKKLAKKIKKLNARDYYGRTALYIATEFKHPEIVQALLNAGANVNIPDLKGTTPLSMAFAYQQYGLAREFLVKNAQFDQGQYYLEPNVCLLILQGQYQLIENLLNKDLLHIQIEQQEQIKKELHFSYKEYSRYIKGLPFKPVKKHLWHHTKQTLLQKLF